MRCEKCGRLPEPVKFKCGCDSPAESNSLSNGLLSATKRRVDEGKLAECPLCGSLDIGGAHDTVHCYGCGLKITKGKPLQNAINAWNMRGGVSLDT